MPGGLIAAAAGALALIAIVVVLVSGGVGWIGPARASGLNRTPSSPSEPKALDPTALEPIPLQPGADGVATGGGFVWVANRDLNTVTRVNARSRQVDGDPIQVGAEPDSLAEGLGAMWVTNTSDNSVTRMELGTGEPMGHPSGRRRPEGIVIAPRLSLDCEWRRRSVSRLDDGATKPPTSEVGEGPVQLAATADAVWVTVSKENKIVELDPDSGEPTGRSVEIDGTPRGIAYEPIRGELWVSASAADRVVIVDPDSAGIETRIKVPDDPREVRFGLDAIWLTSATAQRGHGDRPTKRRRIIESLRSREPPTASRSARGFAWAASEGAGLLLPIRPR